MARLRGTGPTLLTTRDDELNEIRDWYRDTLFEEPAPQWHHTPQLIGPTWRRDEHGWILPESTLGWDPVSYTHLRAHETS